MTFRRFGKYVLSQKTKTIVRHNVLSGHSWTEDKPIPNAYEVSGGLWTRTTHKTVRSALKEIKLRQTMDQKFPYDFLAYNRNRPQEVSVPVKSGYHEVLIPIGDLYPEVPTT